MFGLVTVKQYKEYIMGNVKAVEAKVNSFFSTTTGHMIAGLLGTFITAGLSAVLSLPDVASFVASGGVVATLVKLVTDLLDKNISNL